MLKQWATNTLYILFLLFQFAQVCRYSSIYTTFYEMNLADVNGSNDHLSPTQMDHSEYEYAYNRTVMQEVTIWAVFTVLAIFGSVVNTLMIIILLRIKSSFLTVITTGLCCSDLISAINSPLYIYGHLYELDYKLPWPFCFVWLPVETATSHITTHHVFLLSLIRFVSITKINGSAKDVTAQRCRIFIVTSYVTVFIAHSVFGTMLMEYW